MMLQLLSIFPILLFVVAGCTSSGDGLMNFPFSPVEERNVTVPNRLPLRAMTTVGPGSYTLTATATSVATGEAFSVVVPAKVVEPGTPDPLILGVPLMTPMGAEPNKETIVKIRAKVDTTSKPPEVLFLDVFDLTGKLKEWSTIPQLRDDGKDGVDTVAGDMIYSGTLKINREASELRFRVRAEHFGKEVVSGSTTFMVTDIPVTGWVSDHDTLVPLPATGVKVFANELEIKVIPGVSTKRVEEIAKEINGEVKRAIPPLRVYLITFPNYHGGRGVVDAIAKVSEFSEVERVEPNYPVVAAGNEITFNTGTCDASGAGCPNDGNQDGQWYLDKIKARQAWKIAGGGSSDVKVSLIEKGIECNHADLNGRCTSAGTDTSEKHGTAVASLIAANAHNSTGISGVAWNTSIDNNGVKNIAVDNSLSFKNFLIGMSANADIITISQGWWPDTEPGNLKDALLNLVSANKLIVVAGQDNKDLQVNYYPPTFNENEALAKQLLAVGASDSDDKRWSDSSNADYLDIYAPGGGILALKPGASVSGLLPDTALYNGTSFAAPLVSGAAAVLWAYQEAHPDVFPIENDETRAQAVHDQLKEMADDADTICTGCKRLNLGAAIPRKPSRLILVLDKSGSMAWSSHPNDPGCQVAGPPPEGCGPDRWTILKQAVEQTLAVTGAHEDSASRDQFAVAFFDSNVGTADKSGLTAFGPNVGDFVTDPTRSPGGSTSIGAGVTAFEYALATGAADYRQTILLFTDGDQNWPPFLVPVGSQVLISPTLNSPSGREFPAGVDICPFALLADDPTGLGTTRLQHIADNRCNHLMGSTATFSADGTDPQNFFLQVLNHALTGDKLEIAAVKSGQVNRGERSSMDESFTTSRDDGAFTLLINWPEPHNDLQKVVLSKDGIDFPVTDGSSAIKVTKGTTFMAITLRQPYCSNGNCVENGGEWTLHMTPSFKASDRFKYNFFLTVDNASLESEFRVSQSIAGIGRPLRLTARLTEAGSPMENLRPGSVWAVVSRPKASLGNVLSRAKISPVRRNEGDPVSATGRKVSAMLADKKLRPSILDAVTPGIEKKLVLTEGKPGIYETLYNDTPVSGIYSVRFYVDGQSDINGRFTRTFSSARSVEPEVDQGATLDTIRVSKITPCHLAGGCYAISVKPTDARGNLLGPGKSSLINIAESKFSGRILKPTSDELDGRYTIHIGYPKPRRKDPVIHVGRTKVPIALEK